MGAHDLNYLKGQSEVARYHASANPVKQIQIRHAWMRGRDSTHSAVQVMFKWYRPLQVSSRVEEHDE